MKCLFVGARSSTLVAATMLATYEEAGNMFSSLIGSAVGSRVPAPSAPADCGASSGVSPAVSGTGGGSAPHHKTHTEQEIASSGADCPGAYANFG